MKARIQDLLFDARAIKHHLSEIENLLFHHPQELLRCHQTVQHHPSKHHPLTIYSPPPPRAVVQTIQVPLSMAYRSCCPGHLSAFRISHAGGVKSVVGGCPSASSSPPSGALSQSSTRLVDLPTCLKVKTCFDCLSGLHYWLQSNSTLHLRFNGVAAFRFDTKALPWFFVQHRDHVVSGYHEC